MSPVGDEHGPTLPFSWERLGPHLLQEMADAVIVTDREGVIRLWNTGASTIFGVPADQAVGQSLDLIIPERLRQRHWEGYRRVMQTGATRYGRELLAVPATRADGTRLSVEFTIVPLRDEAGKLFGIAAIMRDVTARWQREKELRERLAAYEERSEVQPQPKAHET
jgi:PAS domain S-box-containing protein